MILAATVVTASVVSICGLIGWVGLLVPHAARMLFGSANERVLPACMLLGGLFLLLIDTAARSLSEAEIPVSKDKSVVVNLSVIQDLVHKQSLHLLDTSLMEPLFLHDLIEECDIKRNDRYSCTRLCHKGLIYSDLCLYIRELLIYDIC